MMAVVLAAGKGSRINARNINKVMYPLAGKPMIGYTIDLLNNVGLEKILLVVGFKKDSIIKYFGKKLIYVDQRRRLGTAHALKCALKEIPLKTKNIFVCYSDDTAFYPSGVIKRLLKYHLLNKKDLSILTVVKKNPFGLGRIIRDEKGKLKGIIEEKSTTATQKKIKEINTGCYCFKVEFIKKYLRLIKKDPIKKEYYLTDIVSLAIKKNKKVGSLKVSKGEYFQGINTKDQLKKAESLMKTRVY